MSIDKYNIDYNANKIWNKDLFVFVNHKTALLCWAIIKAKIGLVDVITFDTHCDFYGGFISQVYFKELIYKPRGERFFASKYKQDDEVKHFNQCKEFVDWNLLNEEENRAIISTAKKFLFRNNDNFIDVAFMKRIVNDVNCYYFIKNRNNGEGVCDDLKGNDHYYTINHVKTFKKSPGKFILDIDLDFFTKTIWQTRLLSENVIVKSLQLIKEQGQSDNCVGITIALEPDCCGSISNCMRICGYLSAIFDKDITAVARDLIKSSIENV